MAGGEATQRYFAADSALFLGPLPPAAMHAHHAIQGALSLSGRLRVETASRAPLETAAVLIGPDVPHALSARGPVAHFYLLPESTAGSRLVAALAGRPFLEPPRDALPELRSLLWRARADEGLFPRCLEGLVAWALDGAPPAPVREPRVAAVLAALGRRPGDTRLADLARQADLSPDRLRHLIRERAGIPLRRYRRWMRLLAALAALRDTRSVTAAAAAAGFADSAHLSRTFREAFTVPPSAFLRDSRFVQAEERAVR